MGRIRDVGKLADHFGREGRDNVEVTGSNTPKVKDGFHQGEPDSRVLRPKCRQGNLSRGEALTAGRRYLVRGRAVVLVIKSRPSHHIIRTEAMSAITMRRLGSEIR